MMTDKELQEMGLTRTEWNSMLEDENQYIQDWSKTVTLQ